MYLVQCHDCHIWITAADVWVRRTPDSAVTLCPTCGETRDGEKAEGKLLITQVEPVETEGTPDGTDKSPAKALTIRLVPLSQTTIASDG